MHALTSSDLASLGTRGRPLADQSEFLRAACVATYLQAVSGQSCAELDRAAMGVSTKERPELSDAQSPVLAKMKKGKLTISHRRKRELTAYAQRRHAEVLALLTGLLWPVLRHWQQDQPCPFDTPGAVCGELAANLVPAYCSFFGESLLLTQAGVLGVATTALQAHSLALRLEAFALLLANTRAYAGLNEVSLLAEYHAGFVLPRLFAADENWRQKDAFAQHSALRGEFIALVQQRFRVFASAHQPAPALARNELTMARWLDPWAPRTGRLGQAARTARAAAQARKTIGR